MTLHIITIVLDGMPYIKRQYDCLCNLQLDWTWHVREGAANNVNCTSWCRKQLPRLSLDGTREFMRAVKRHDWRIDYVGKAWWEQGKVEMFNDAVARIHNDCVLLQMDSDEIWSPEQLKDITGNFRSNPTIGIMQFYCRYFVGESVITLGDNCYGNYSNEWVRAWRFSPGMRFEKHEPPILSGAKGQMLKREKTKKRGLIFDHFAYALEKQVAYKEQFYGYENAVDCWRRLQKNTRWPIRLKQFLHWVDDTAMATKI